jgi:hypothetical protein
MKSRIMFGICGLALAFLFTSFTSTESFGKKQAKRWNSSAGDCASSGTMVCDREVTVHG